MFHVVWCTMVCFSVIFAAWQGKMEALLSGALQSAENAVSLMIRLSAGYAFFCGWMELMKALNLPRRLEKGMTPALKWLFPRLKSEPAREAIAMNFTANLLGLGNAATPAGVRAMELLAEESGGAVSDAMKMFLVVNATSLQLLPTTVIALRASAGSAEPAAILWPSLACTAVSTVAGTLCARWAMGRRRHAAA